MAKVAQAMPHNEPKRLCARCSDIEALAHYGYMIGKKIGKGSYATVITAEYEDESLDHSLTLACKIIDKNKAPLDFLYKFLPRELEILTKIEHPYIIEIHSIIQRGPKIFIFMRYAENGDLLDYIKSHGPTSEQQSRIWFIQITKALKYLHSKDIAHRDLKCENILLSKNLNIKLADFGFARYCINSKGKNIMSETYCGSAAYAAPEVVKGIPYDPKIADIWSLGIILFIMLNAKMPFNDSNLSKLLEDQKNRKFSFRQKIAGHISPQVKCVVNMLLEPEVTERWRLDDILNCKWVKHPILLENTILNREETPKKGISVEE